MATSMTNGAFSTLASGISAGATSLSVQSGHGARFPSSNFYICVYDSIYPNWAEAYRASTSAGEIMLCSSRSTDTLTVTRAQGGTSAVAFNTTGRTYRVELNVTKEAFDVATASTSGLVSTSAQTFGGVKTIRDGLVVGASTTVDGYTRYLNSSDSNYIDLYTPTGVTANRSVILPDANGTLALYDYAGSFILNNVFVSGATYTEGDRYYIPFGNTTAYTTTGATQSGTSVPFRAPFSGTLFGLTVVVGANSLNAGSFVVKVNVAGSDTALSASVAAAALVAYDSTNAVSVSKGDSILFHKIQATGASSGSYGPLNMSVIFKKNNTNNS